MSLNFKYIPLTFLNDVNIIKEQIKNTVILKYLFNKYNEYSTLDNLIIGTQYGYNASALQSGQNKFFRISDITDGKVDWNKVPFCDCTDESTYLLNNHDLLIARTGGTTGKSFMINNPPDKAIFAGYLIRIRANKENNPEFLNLFLNSYVYWSQVVSLNKGEFRPSVNATKLKNLIVPKIDIEIQKEAINISKGISVDGYEELENDITKALNGFDKSQEILKRFSIQLRNTDLLKQSILQEAIQGILTADWREKNPNRESANELLKRIKAEKVQLIKDKKIKKENALPPITEEEIPFDLPDDWTWCRLGDLVQTNAGKTLHKGQNKGEFKDYITTSNLYWGEFKLDNVKQIQLEEKELERCTATHGDLLICEGGDVGRSAIWDKDYEICFQNHIHRVRPYEGILNLYLYYFMKSLYLSGRIKDYKKGMGIGNLSGKALKSIILPVCSFEEQKVIVEKVENLMQKCQALEEEIKTSEANAQMLMQAVLKEAFEGKKDQVEV